MDTRVVIVSALLVVGVFLGFYFVTPPSTVCSGDLCFTVELADEPAERQEGLMGRDSLCSQCGMLFLFPDERVRSFWMKNMKISLDILWLDSSGKTLYVAENVSPCGEGECIPLSPNVSAQYVLELPSGTIAYYNLSSDTLWSFH